MSSRDWNYPRERPNQLIFRLTDEERDDVARLVEEMGVSRSDMLMELVRAELTRRTTRVVTHA